MGGCQNYGPFLGPCDNTAPGTPKGANNLDNYPYNPTVVQERLTLFG